MAIFRKGDVNMDGLITQEDRNLIINFNNGTDTNLTAEQQALADVNGDGQISFSDVLESADLLAEESKVYGIKNSGVKQEILTALVNGGNDTCVRGTYGSKQSDGSIVYPKASGSGEMAIGCETKATGGFSFASGIRTTADGYGSFVEGAYSHAEGDYAHAEGSSTWASGAKSHAEGAGSQSQGEGSHAEGEYAYAIGKGSHAEGLHTEAHGDYQHVQGKYNVINTDSDYAHILGNGESGARSNAHTIDWDGNAWFAGNVYTGGTKESEGKQLVSAYDGLDSTSTTEALTANQGKILNDKISSINSILNYTGNYAKYTLSASPTTVASANGVYYIPFDTEAVSAGNNAMIVNAGNGWIKLNTYGHRGLAIINYNLYCSTSNMNNCYVHHWKSSTQNSSSLCQHRPISSSETRGTIIAPVGDGDMFRLGTWTVAESTYTFLASTDCSFFDVALLLF